MKRVVPETDAPERVHHTKDKRLLVLFVLGLLILAADLLPPKRLPSRPAYGVAMEQPADGAQGWRIVTMPATTTTGETGEGTTLLPLDPLQPLNARLPAVYALFVHQPLPINRADRATLEMLPGVGPQLAAAIERERQHRGPLTGAEDMLQIPGIGPRNLQHLLPLVRFQ
jgi:competence protein ComEA